jgi:hypothetical protein
MIYLSLQQINVRNTLIIKAFLGVFKKYVFTGCKKCYDLEQKNIRFARKITGFVKPLRKFASAQHSSTQ